MLDQMGRQYQNWKFGLIFDMNWGDKGSGPELKIWVDVIYGWPLYDGRRFAQTSHAPDWETKKRETEHTDLNLF